MPEWAPLSETRPIASRMVVAAFLTWMPCCWTSGGSRGIADCNLFWTWTWAMSRIGALLEGQGDGDGAGRGRARREIAQVIDPLQLLLDDLGSGILQRLRVGAREGGADRHRRRRDRRELRDRQGQHRDAARQHHDQRDHPGEDRAIDEIARHRASYRTAAGRDPAAVPPHDRGPPSPPRRAAVSARLRPRPCRRA